MPTASGRAFADRRRTRPRHARPTSSWRPTESTRPSADAASPAEGPPRWNGVMMWRGATALAGVPDRPLDDHRRRHGGEARHLPDRRRATARHPAHQLGRLHPHRRSPVPPPERQDWSRPGDRDALPAPRTLPVAAGRPRRAGRGHREIFEFPMCDRDPLPALVARTRDAARRRRPPDVPDGLQRRRPGDPRRHQPRPAPGAPTPIPRGARGYQAIACRPTAEIVLRNRRAGRRRDRRGRRRAPDGFEDIDAVLPHAERAAIVQGYAAQAGFAPRR